MDHFFEIIDNARMKVEVSDPYNGWSDFDKDYYRERINDLIDDLKKPDIQSALIAAVKGLLPK